MAYQVDHVNEVDMCTYNAKEFNKAPLAVFRKADKGKVVKINHSHYPDVIFELTARPRNPVPENKSDGQEGG